MSVQAHAGFQAATGSAFESWSLPVLELEQFRQLDRGCAHVVGTRQACYLLGFSLLAPSTHNTVPQAYRMDLARARIELWLRREHVLPASDPEGKEALVSAGCALENLSLAAAQFGIACSWHPAPDLSWGSVTPAKHSSPVRLGHVELAPASSQPDPPLRRATLRGMLQRRMVRSEFDPSHRLPAQLHAALGQACEGVAVRLRIFESATDKFAWGKLDELAMKHKLEERSFRHELGAWLLPNSDDHSPRGMRGREFGFEDRLSCELPAQLRDELPMAVDQLTFMSRAGRVGLCSAGAVCVLSCSNPSPPAALAAGLALQRCLLAAGRHGWVGALHTGICHVPHARSMSRATLLKSCHPDVILRLGKPLHAADAHRAPASRPRLEDVLLGDAT
jgi:hypothetical protein